MIKKIIVSVIKGAKSLVDEFRARVFGWGFSVSLIGWVGGAITAAIYWLLGGIGIKDAFAYLLFEFVLGVGMLLLALFVVDCIFSTENVTVSIGTAFVLLMVIISTSHAFAVVANALWFGFVVTTKVMVFSLIAHPAYILIGFVGMALLAGSVTQEIQGITDDLHDW